MNYFRNIILPGLVISVLWPAALHGKPLVLVSIPPQKAFVEAIAGDSVDIQVLLQPGQSPENFTLSPSTLSIIAKADAYFTIGVPMESTILPRIEKNYPEIQVVNTDVGIRKRTLEDHTHAGGETGEAHQHTQDPHIWLSPGLVKIQLKHYLRTLTQLSPEKSEDYEDAYREFLDKLEELDNELKEMLKDFKRATVFVYHPAFGYFLDRYGLRQATVELQGKQPSPKQLRYLILLAKEFHAKVIFVQPQFDRNSAKMLAKAIGGRVEPLDPLAENYLDNLRKMGETIAESYR
jgi:zinc transport system substrate-binding protein